jgi:ABC-2 type transport system ATP-binding protein
MLEARQLTKFYGSVPAVQEISFQIAPGSVLGYLGPNGSGKSTTVKMLIGLLQPTHGEVRFGGRNIQHDLLAYRRHLGYVPEEPNLYPHLTGWEYLEMVGTLREISEASLATKADQLLDLLALGAYKHVQMSAYSKGMRQRILLIAALMDNPDVLVLDEPLSGLDVSSAMVVKNLIQILSSRGKFIFYCSHVLEVVEKVCTQFIVIRKGRMIASGSTDEVRCQIGQSTLEQAFVQLVEDKDAGQIACDIVSVMMSPR